jgi:hypothetical protein
VQRDFDHGVIASPVGERLAHALVAADHGDRARPAAGQPPGVAAAQRARRVLPKVRLLAGMSCSAGMGTAESGHLVPNPSPASSLMLLAGIGHSRPATFVQPP